MSYIIFIFVTLTALLSVSAYNGEFNVMGKLELPASTYGEADQKCKSEGFRCEKSCESERIQYCPRVGIEPTEQLCETEHVCSDVNGSPTCVKKGASECHQEFKCPSSSSFFPNINNCKSYYYCDEDRNSHLLHCPENFVYDPLRHNCGPVSQGLKCWTLSCPSEAKLLPYPGDKSLYVVCMAGRSLLQQCEEPAEFSQNSKKCVGLCRSRGKFAFKNDSTCRNFYTCITPNTQPVRDQCPKGTVFNQTTQSCNPGKCNEK